MKVFVPPIKSQGIKTKLVPWIHDMVPRNFDGRWIEPFMGTGVVAFNMDVQHALLCDTNPHLIAFYKAVQKEMITPLSVRNYLNKEGALLVERGEKHYYDIRRRFNAEHDPLDFLFLNRAGFNGMIRFNRKGEFNIPFCKKPHRFAQAYVTKIVNQLSHVSHVIRTKDFVFERQDFSETIDQATSEDIVYCDPPYIGRHVDYFNGWNETQEEQLFRSLSSTNGRFILSTWHHNDYRKNAFIELLWNRYKVLTREHYYHVGGKESNRNPMVEALVLNYEVEERESRKKEIFIQPDLFLLGRQAV